MTRIEVDWTRCDGHGLCAVLVPELLSLDEWGFPIIAGELKRDTERYARRAVMACPSLALRIESH
jgi:ferredoxin